MIKSVTIKVVPHIQQRYETIGDYVEITPGTWTIFISDLGDWRMNLAVAIHELVEVAQTENNGVSEPIIKEFDEHFEAQNKDPDAEPGEQINAPYHKEHVNAENIERQFAAMLGIEWAEYERAVSQVWRPK